MKNRFLFALALILTSMASAAMPEYLRSAQEQVISGAPEQGKQTVCTITLNSSNERNLFEKKLDPTKFKFVELTLPEQWAPNTDPKKGWFDRSCDSNIQCDMLIISGHFGGTFFGSTGKSLSFEELENRSCRKSCNGILSNPKEVFLFGCNTLATKEADARTRDQYIQVLLEEIDAATNQRLYTQAEAESVAEARYGATGEQNRDRMRRIFLNVPYIYGFKTKAPMGYAIAPALSNYIDAVLPYEKHLAELTANANSVQNEALNTHLKDIPHKGLFQCAGLSGLNQNDPYYEVSVNMCKFYNLIDNDIEKIKFIYKLLRQTKNPNIYLPPVIELLARNNKLITSSAASTLKSSSEIKALYLGLLKDIITPMIKSQWLVVGKKLDWITETEYQAGAAELYAKIFSSKINNESAAATCTLEFNNANNPRVDINGVAASINASHFTNAASIQTVYCSRALQNENVLALLETAIRDGITGKNKNLSALIGIMDMKGLTLSPKLSAILKQIIPTCIARAEVVESCVAAFNNLDARNTEIVSLANLTISEKSAYAPNALLFLAKTKNRYSGNEMDIAHQMAAVQGYTMRSYGEYFAQFPPTSSEATSIIIKKCAEDLSAGYELVRSLQNVQISEESFIALAQAQHSGRSIADAWQTLFNIGANQKNFTTAMAQELFKKTISMNGLPAISQALQKLFDNTSFQAAVLQDATAFQNMCLSANESSKIGGTYGWDCFDKVKSWSGARNSAIAQQVANQLGTPAARKFAK